VTAFATRTAAGWLLAVHAQPGAKRSELAGLHGTSLKVRIAAPAVDGRANAALEAFLAERLGIARAKVQVVRGEHAREKRVAIADPAAEVERLLA
jgi:uncharacterized protein (TIGR00251 family)